MTIVKIESIDGFHHFEFQSHRTENWMGEEWIAVPENLISNINSGYCELVIQDGILIDIIPTEIPGEVLINNI